MRGVEISIFEISRSIFLMDQKLNELLLEVPMGQDSLVLSIFVAIGAVAVYP